MILITVFCSNILSEGLQTHHWSYCSIRVCKAMGSTIGDILHKGIDFFVELFFKWGPYNSSQVDSLFNNKVRMKVHLN
jgi:hypothetical protein